MSVTAPISLASPRPASAAPLLAAPANAPVNIAGALPQAAPAPGHFSLLSQAIHPDAANSGTAEGAGKADEKGLLKGRTRGMWLFDSMLYPVLANGAVFAVSVLATFATTYGRPGNFMKVRGDWARKQLQRYLKMNEQSAKEAIMITFSFLDGCVMAPVIKMFEDRRMKISETFDRWMGTTPQDRSVYDKEPKQTWGSVLGGRTAAFLLVFPTFKLLSLKMGGKNSLNQLIFEEPGKKVGEWLAKKWPRLQKRFPKIPQLAEVGFLEAFYTTLCTAGLYFSSRFLAGRGDKQASAESAPAPVPTMATT